MNLMFEWQKQEQEQELISLSQRKMYFLLYRQHLRSESKAQTFTM